MTTHVDSVTSRHPIYDSINDLTSRYSLDNFHQCQITELQQTLQSCQSAEMVRQGCCQKPSMAKPKSGVQKSPKWIFRWNWLCYFEITCLLIHKCTAAPYKIQIKSMLLKKPRPLVEGYIATCTSQWVIYVVLFNWRTEKKFKHTHTKHNDFTTLIHPQDKNCIILLM